MILTMLGDCHEKLKEIADGSVGLVLVDPPYATTQAKRWDNPLDWARIWPEVRRVLKPEAPALVFCAQPFTTDLITSNRRYFKYLWYWHKVLAGSFANAKHQPLRVVEEIAVFSTGTPPYYPQMRRGKLRVKGRRDASGGDGRSTMNAIKGQEKSNDQYHPTTLIEFSKGNREEGGHPTSKPVPLCSYLIRSFTKPGDTVLDFCAGGGSTLAACVDTGRNGIGIEADPEFFVLLQQRVQKAEGQTRMTFNEMEGVTDEVLE